MYGKENMENRSINESVFEKHCKSLSKKKIKNNRLLFIQIPQVILDSFNQDVARAGGYYIFPPTGIQFLCESIKHRSLDVKILDLNYEILKRTQCQNNFKISDWIDIFKKELNDFQPSIIGISCLFDVGIEPMITILKNIQLSYNPIVICGGIIATYEWENLLCKKLCDFVIKGEGENKLNYLLDYITDENHKSKKTPGIFFHSKNGCHETIGAPDIVNIQGDLIDSYQLINISEYYKYGSLNPFSRRESGHSAPFAAIQIGRGCRAQCTFCAVRDFMGKGVRIRPLKHILNEMSYLITHHNVSHFELLDDDPTFYHHDFKKLLSEIIKRKWNIQWSANNGIIAASIDKEMLKLMRDSGCIGFKIGIETGNPDLLRKIKKPATHNKFIKFSEMLNDYPEIFVGGNFIVGLPDETFSQMIDSFRFALKVDLDWAAYTVCQMIRGASAFADAGEYFESQIQSDGKITNNFIPTRSSGKGEIAYNNQVFRGLDIFNMPLNSVPSKDQIKEIWFTFNLTTNYIFNKNITPRGEVNKFITWVNRIRSAYPKNPYMNLFLAIGHQINGNKEDADFFLKQSRFLYKQNEYWQDRLVAFHLDSILYDFPNSAEETCSRIEDLQQCILKEINIDSILRIK